MKSRPQQQLQNSISVGLLQQSDLVSIILSYLNWKEIFKARVVCQKWKEAACITPVAQTYYQEFSPIGTKTKRGLPIGPVGVRRGGGAIPELWVSNLDFGKALEWISIALPKIPGITIRFNIGGTVFPIAPGEEAETEEGGNGENGDEEAKPGEEESLDLCVLSNFRHLQTLALNRVGLRGRYPYLFQFQKLHTLCVSSNSHFQWDLKDLSGLPNLRHLRAVNNFSLTGNLKSIRTLSNTLIELRLMGCTQIEGSIHDLANFSLLEEVDVSRTLIEGDIRKIRRQDFPSIKALEVTLSSVYGGQTFDSIEDAPLLMQARYYLIKRNPEIPISFRRWNLADDSPDRYHRILPLQGRQKPSLSPPLWVEFIKAGPRIGWRWTNATRGGSCEPNWFDPEPEPTSSQATTTFSSHDDNSYSTTLDSYNIYLQKIKRIESDVTIYKGYKTTPPTADQYYQLLQQRGL